MQIISIRLEVRKNSFQFPDELDDVLLLAGKFIRQNQIQRVDEKQRRKIVFVFGQEFLQPTFAIGNLQNHMATHPAIGKMLAAERVRNRTLTLKVKMQHLGDISEVFYAH